MSFLESEILQLSNLLVDLLPVVANYKLSEDFTAGVATVKHFFQAIRLWSPTLFMTNLGVA